MEPPPCDLGEHAEPRGNWKAERNRDECPWSSVRSLRSDCPGVLHALHVGAQQALVQRLPVAGGDPESEPEVGRCIVCRSPLPSRARVDARPCSATCRQRAQRRGMARRRTA